MPSNTFRNRAIGLIIFFVMFILVLATVVLAAPPQFNNKFTPQHRLLRTIDGDTFRYYWRAPRTYRMLDYDTPEIFHPKCKEELELGLYAKQRLDTVLHSEQNVTIKSLRNKFDKYGRRLARVTVGGISVAKVMIQENLAVPYDGKSPRIDWCKWIADKKKAGDYIPIEDR